MPELPDLDEPNFTVELEDTGEKISSLANNIKAYELDSAWSTPTDGWRFTVYSNDNPAALRDKFRPWRPVKLYIDGQLQVVGRIDGNRGAGESGAALEVFGRDYLSDVVDSNVDPAIVFTKGMDLGTALLQILRPHGIGQIIGGNQTRNLLTGKSRFGKVDNEFRQARLQDFNADENEGAWELAAAVAARHDYTIQPGTDRTAVVLAKPDYDQDILCTLTRPGNILTAECERNFTNVPTLTVATGRFGGTAGTPSKGSLTVATFGEQADPSSPIRTIGVRFDPKNPQPGPDFPVYRPMYYRDAEARTEAQLGSALTRRLAERLRQTLQYKCTLRGHHDPKTGAVYAVDTMVQLNDQIEGLSERLWVSERTFRNDGSGPITELTLQRPDSYQIQGKALAGAGQKRVMLDPAQKALVIRTILGAIPPPAQPPTNRNR